MKTFKQKSLYAALAGVSALGVTGAAQAVNVNPDGLGQVLIYPYYTTREDAAGNSYSSLLTVVNSTASAKAVKVRFLEGKNSQEVLDFNLFLSAHDVWTAAILPTSAGGAGVGTFDKSCTVPTVSSDAANPSAFKNTLLGEPYIGDKSLDRTREGYAEIIEMGTILNGTSTWTAVTHVNGVPPCTASALATATATLNTTNPTGGLFGDMTLLNVESVMDLSEDAIALDNFRNIAGYQDPSSIRPDLTEANPPVSVVVANNAVYQSFWNANTADPISALFMHDQVYNTFVLDSGTKSGTDWVLTFPTKRYYYFPDGSVNYLFQRNFAPDGTGACDDVSATLYDREERTVQAQVGFSPPEPNAPNTLCWEANVLTFNSSKVLASTNLRNIDTNFQNGWANLNFTFQPGADFNSFGPHVLLDNSATVTPIGGGPVATALSYVGLPVIGFAVETYNNGTLSGGTIMSNYGGSYVHKGTRFITDAPLAN
jgi:hypothetical protein